MNKKSSVFIILSTAALLSACADTYTFNSNLNSQAIDSYFKPGTVQVFDETNKPTTSYQMIALVEGESCQLSPNDKPASNEEARTNARLKAADIEANGIIFSQCLTTETDGSTCVSRISCFGHAIKL